MKLLRSRIALRKEDERRCRIRMTPTKVLFRGKSVSPGGEKLDIEDVRKYWKGIVGRAKPFDYKNEDLVAWSAAQKEIKTKDDLSDRLSHELWEEATKKAKPWKAHGPDGLQGLLVEGIQNSQRSTLSTCASTPNHWGLVAR